MAVSADDLARLRRVMPSSFTKTDSELTELITAEGSVEGAAASLWEQRAAEVSELVDVEESGSKRSMSQLAKSANQQVAYWRGAASEIVPPVTSRSRTRLITRG